MKRLGHVSPFCLRIVTAILIGALLVSHHVMPALGQMSGTYPVEELTATSKVAIDFPTGLRFTTTLSLVDAQMNIQTDEVDLVYLIGDDETERLIIVPVSELRQVDDRTIAVGTLIDFQQAGIPPGLEITFWWQVNRDNLALARSQPDKTTWIDNRQEWSELSTAQVHLHYFDLDADFARGILDSAQSTITRLESTYSLDNNRAVSIWVYPNQDSFRGSLPANSRDTIAGGSYIGFSLIAAVIPNKSTSEIGRVIPHEISHQVLFQATRNPFTILPVWFDEGMATHTQVGGTSSYMGMVINASVSDSLFDLTSLAASFPFVPSQATLAYASSWSAIQYIEQKYGQEGITALIAAFKSGVSYDQVIRDALGISMDQLNADWKAWIASQIPT